MAEKLVFNVSVAAARAWAKTSVNYPAGPNAWNGQPVRVNPVPDEFTPNTGIAAQNVNFLIGERGDRLDEVRADLLRIQRTQEAGALQTLQAFGGVDLAGVAVTPRGRVYVAAFTAGANDASVLMTNGRRYGMGATPASGGNLTPTFVSAAGERAFFGDSPQGFIYYPGSAMIAVAEPGVIPIAAVPDAAGTGWLSVWSDSAAHGGNVVGVRGPRVFRGRPAATLQTRKVSSLGVVGPDTALSSIAGSPALYASDVPVKLGLVRCGAGSSHVVFFCSGFTGELYRLVHSADDGDSWANRTLPAGPAPGGDNIMSVAWCPIGNALVLTMQGSATTNVYRSYDYGVTWELSGGFVRDTTNPGLGLFSAYDLRTLSGGAVLAMGLSVADIGAIPVFPVHASIDQGRSWSLVGDVLDTGAGFPTFACDDSPMMIIGGAGNGMHVPTVPLFGFVGQGH
jgi:hypothetical protein